MLRQEYHYLIAGLPELQFDEGKVTSTLLAFREELKQHLSASDYLSVHRLFLPYDNANLVGYLVSGLENFDPLGNYTPDSFAEQVNRIKSILPQKPVLEPYLVKFITNWLSEESGSNSVNPGLALTTEYYNENIAAASGFLKEWLIFNRNIKNIITALLCRKHKLDPAPQMIGEEGIVPHLIRGNARDFGLSTELDYVDRLVQISEHPDLMERERRIDLLRWEFISSKTIFHYFDIDAVLAYLLRLEMVIRWARLDKTTGEQFFRTLLNKLGNSYEFPEDFKRRK
ncbi:MAG: DUF2764 family protein, partial [Bacteroidales bacterium]